MRTLHHSWRPSLHDRDRPLRQANNRDSSFRRPVHQCGQSSCQGLCEESGPINDHGRQTKSSHQWDSSRSQVSHIVFPSYLSWSLSRKQYDTLMRNELAYFSISGRLFWNVLTSSHSHNVTSHHTQYFLNNNNNMSFVLVMSSSCYCFDPLAVFQVSRHTL